jgi:hypothetical protein
LISAERTIHLIGAVNGQVEFGQVVERIERHAELDAEPRRAFGCRHTLDIEAFGDLFRKKADEFIRGGTGSDAEPHSVLDMFEGCLCCCDLELPGVHACLPLLLIPARLLAWKHGKAKPVMALHGPGAAASAVFGETGHPFQPDRRGFPLKTANRQAKPQIAPARPA